MTGKTKTFILRFLLTLVLVFFLIENPVNAQKRDSLYFFVDLPILDFPDNSRTKFRAASMQQSLKMTKSFYYSVHYGLEIWGKKKLGKNGKFWSKVIMSVFDFAPIPLSNTWLHEEWHRSILSLNDVDSQNTYWANSVKKVDDKDLISFKARSPQDFVRQATAGNEGNLEFVMSIQKDVFNKQVNTWNYGLYWGNYAVNSFYLFGSTRKGSKPLVKFKNGENEDIQDRDANGYDPINATFDLFNPDSPYEARGIHPSGIGIDRYVEFNNLSLSAQQFLKNQFSLSLLNFLDLNLFGIDELGKKLKYNLSIRHHMTSFGYMLSGNIFVKTEKYAGMIRPKFYKNNERAFFGLDLEMGNNWAKIRLAGWQQPEHQFFKDSEAAWGGLISASLRPQLTNHINPYVECTLKSKGWVAGNPYLDKNFTCLMGLSMKF